MEVKLWQVIWLLLKQWRDWNKPVNFVGLITGLRKFGVKTAKSEELEQIRLNEFIDSIENPTPEQVARNIRLVVPPEVPQKPLTDEEKAEYEKRRVKNLELSIAILAKQIESKSPEQMDQAFWDAAYNISAHYPTHVPVIDLQKFREAVKNKQKVTQLGHTDFLDAPEDIVPGEAPISIQLSVPKPKEKHVLDND